MSRRRIVSPRPARVVVHDRREPLQVRALAWLETVDHMRDAWGLGGFAPIEPPEIDELVRRRVLEHGARDDLAGVMARAAQLRRETPA